jgi:hypothetical protein
MPEDTGFFCYFDGMEFVAQVLLFSSYVTIALLLFGMYKPWVVVWWEDKQNRKKVILIYGVATAILLSGWWIITLIKDAYE